mmetsp:Transcript_25842/g.70085  ORF Transcript_25842/g.70085 Transcript_25842/m.70085 type:complete len:541 (+) Transcript_25842:179-1801(+)
MTGSNLGDLGARTPGAELQGAQGPPVDNSRSRLLQLHGSLLGLVFSFLEPADRKTFLSVSRDARSDAVLSQITSLDIDLGKDLPERLLFPKGAKCLSLTILGAEDGSINSLDRLMKLCNSWRTSPHAQLILQDLLELNIVECDIEEEVMARILAYDIASLCPKLSSLSICRSLVHAALFQGLAARSIPLVDLHVCHSSIDEEFSSSIKRLPKLDAVSLHVCGAPSQLAAIAMIGDKLKSLQVGHLREDSAPCFASILSMSPQLECVQIDSLNPPPGIDWSSSSVTQLSFTTLSIFMLPDLLAAHLPQLSTVKAEAFLMGAVTDEESAADLADKLSQNKTALEALPIDCDSGVLLVGSSVDNMHARQLLQALQPLQETKLVHAITAIKTYNVTFSAGAMSSLSKLFPNVHSLWLGKCALHSSSLVEAVQGFSQLCQLDLADKRDKMLQHHDSIVAACTCAQLSQRTQDLRVRMLVRSDRSFGEAVSDSDSEAEEGEPLNMSDVMPQCQLVLRWEEIASSLGYPCKVRLLLDAPTVAPDSAV